MSDKASLQRACLDPLVELFRESGLEAVLIEPSEQSPYFSLLVQLEQLGKGNHKATLSFALPTTASDLEGESFLLLMNCTLSEEVADAAVGPLVWMVNALNTRLGLGAFAVQERERHLVFRQSFVISRSVPTEHQVKLVDQQLGVVLHELELFIDALMDVAAGRRAPVEALRAHPLANLFALDAAPGQ